MIATTVKTNKVKLACGAQALVKRVRRSHSDRLMASITAGTNEALVQMHVQLVVRSAVVGIEPGPAGEVLTLDGEAVEFSAEKGVGGLAHVDVYDALTAVDAAAVYNAALSGLSEEQKGN